jgi:hypothetical protein
MAKAVAKAVAIVLASVRHQTAFKPFGVLGSVCIFGLKKLDHFDRF